jgi:hypothetical protein
MRSFLLPSFNKAVQRGSHTTTLVTHGLSRWYNQAALAVRHEGDLRVNYVCEEIVIAFREYLDRLLTGRLRNETPSIASNGRDKVRPELIAGRRQARCRFSRCCTMPGRCSSTPVSPAASTSLHGRTRVQLIDAK